MAPSKSNHQFRNSRLHGRFWLLHARFWLLHTWFWMFPAPIWVCRCCFFNRVLPFRGLGIPKSTTTTLGPARLRGQGAKHARMDRPMGGTALIIVVIKDRTPPATDIEISRLFASGRGKNRGTGAVCPPVAVETKRGAVSFVFGGFGQVATLEVWVKISNLDRNTRARRFLFEGTQRSGKPKGQTRPILGVALKRLTRTATDQKRA